jgi:hypothetical protein
LRIVGRIVLGLGQLKLAADTTAHRACRVGRHDTGPGLRAVSRGCPWKYYGTMSDGEAATDLALSQDRAAETVRRAVRKKI